MNKFYFIHVYGGCDPYMHGPYETPGARDVAAKDFYCSKEMDEDDNIFGLDVENGVPEVWAYSGGTTSDWLEEAAQKEEVA